MKKIFGKISLTILLLILTLGCTACTFIQTENPSPPTDSISTAQNVTFNTEESNTTPTDELNLEQAIAKVERTSVAIYTTSGAGSGVIIDIKDSTKTNSDNYIYVITCHHVIEGKGTVDVVIPDEVCSYGNDDYTFRGSIGNDTFANINAVTLVGGDRDSDIALLRIDMTKAAISGKVLSQDKIVKAKVPENYSVSKGETIFSIGNPTGMLPGSVSDGIVSFLERDVFIDSLGEMKLLQISVTTNPGNSGGGLYNLKGELIGITNAGNTSYEAINYAIPAVLSNNNGFISIASQLLGTQTDTNYGFISGRKEKFGFTATLSQDETFVSVSSINQGSIAESAGMRVNDKIDSIVKPDGTEVNITSLDALSSVIGGLQIGDTITIKISRISGFNIVKIPITMVVKQYHFCDTGR